MWRDRTCERPCFLTGVAIRVISDQQTMAANQPPASFKGDFMNILGICKTVSRGCASMAVVMLLLASLTTAQDKDKDKDKEKDKKKDSTPAKSAPAQKPSAPADKEKASGPGRTEGAN